MKIEQFIMAYKVEQDRLRAMLPNGFESLRPVLRINTEIRNNDFVYIELNTPVKHSNKRGWLNIEKWKSPEADIYYEKHDKSTSFSSTFLDITYTGIGIEGGCPAESDNDGCFFMNEATVFRESELIKENREFCDVEFRWKFAEDNAHGISIGDKSVPAFFTEPQRYYEKKELSADVAASIKCERILGSYVVRFER